MKYNPLYERTLGNLFIMFSPIAPLFASECWSKLLSVPNRIDTNTTSLKWNEDVLEQNWPTVDKNFADIFVIRVSFEVYSIYMNRNQHISMHFRLTVPK